MKFHLKADATFEAANMDEALSVLSNHFFAVLAGEADQQIKLTGPVSILPVPDTAPSSTDPE
jgi:hypothetical protein